MPGTQMRAAGAHCMCRWFVRASTALLLWACATGVHAATVYRCVNTHGAPAFQDAPCAAGATQDRIDVSPQPPIGGPGNKAAPSTVVPTHRRAHAQPHRRRARATHRKQAMAWECHAADGEVFYRYARCPGSVPGDGTVRTDYAEKFRRTRGHERHDAWSRVRVHGVRIPRAEACLRIHGVAASSRDGHLRDAKVSVYDHLMGRDPCSDE